MNWFQKKHYPDYWNEYAASFKNKNKKYEEIRFVVFDTETTGLDTHNDEILSIGAVAVQNKRILIQDSFECFLNPKDFKKETVKIHGIRKTSANKIEEEQAIKAFLNYLSNGVLVAHHAGFDVNMINKSLKKLGLPKLKNTVIDTGTLYVRSGLSNSNKTHFGLDEISEQLNIPPHDRHNAAGDAYITAQVFIKLLSKFQKNNTLSLPFLKRPAKRIGLL